MARTSYAGAAPKVTLSGSMSASSPTSGGTFAVNEAATAYPDGSVGAFVVVVDRGTSAEEKILCSARSGSTFTVATGGRGYDGTVAASHDVGHPVEHVVDAASLTDNQRHLYAANAGKTDHTELMPRDGTAAFTGVASIANVTPSTQAVGDAAAIGTANTLTRSDHKHGMPAFAGTGAAATIAHSDHTHAGATSDTAVITGFYIATPSTSQTNVAMGRAASSSITGYTSDRACSVTGLTLAAASARSAGTFTAEVTINGAGTGLTAAIDGTHTQYWYAIQAAALDNVVAGDRIGVRWTTDASFAQAGTSGVEASVTVQY